MALVLLRHVSRWYAAHLADLAQRPRMRPSTQSPVSRRAVMGALSVLLVLLFSKYVYLASLSTYYTFYLIERFQLSVFQAQLCLFTFLFATAVGTAVGGPLGDRIGRKAVIWFSILGTAPFTLALPYVGLTATVALTLPIGLILASAFSAMLVYAQDLLPGKVGLVAGLFFGVAFGIAGISSALLGKLADTQGITTVYHLCSYLPLLGLLTVFLPDLRPAKPAP